MKSKKKTKLATIVETVQPRSPSSDEIARRAHEIWASEGQPVGRDLEHWLQAEAQLKGTSTEAVSNRSTAVPR